MWRVVGFGLLGIVSAIGIVVYAVALMMPEEITVTTRLPDARYRLIKRIDPRTGQESWEPVQLTSSQTVTETYRRELTLESKARCVVLASLGAVALLVVVVVIWEWHRALSRGGKEAKELWDFVQKSGLLALGALVGFLTAGGLEERWVPVHNNDAAIVPQQFSSPASTPWPSESAAEPKTTVDGELDAPMDESFRPTQMVMPKGEPSSAAPADQTNQP